MFFNNKIKHDYSTKVEFKSENVDQRQNLLQCNDKTKFLKRKPMEFGVFWGVWTLTD